MPVIPDDLSDKQLLFALEHSNYAIKELTKPSPRRSLADSINVMAASIIFFSLSCLQGDTRTALSHLRSGLNILHQIDQAPEDHIKSAQNHPISLDTIRAMFVMMDVQARGMMSEDVLHAWTHRPKRSFGQRPSSFKTFTQARSYFESFYYEVVGFMQALDVNFPSDADETAHMLDEYRRCQDEFDEMSEHLDRFLGRLSHVTSQADLDSIVGIKLFREQVKIFMRVFGNLDGERHPRKVDLHVEENEMKNLLDLASAMLRAPVDVSLPRGAEHKSYYPCAVNLEQVSQMLRMSRGSQPETRASSQPVYSSNSGVLSALWLAAIKPTSVALRRRAIALLLGCSRREGIWDGVLAGRIAWEWLLLEEAAVDGELGANPDNDGKETIEACNKVGDCKIRYIAPRAMEIVFRSQKQWAAGPEGGGVTRVIAW